MFKNISSFLKGSNFLNTTLSEFKEMLDHAEEMFSQVCRTLIHGKENPDLRKDLYEHDKKINCLEKDIRKRIVEHLVLQPTVDVSTCLVLMSVVKDAERLGDYCKNLYEVTELFEKPLNKEKFEELFNGMESELTEFFKETKKAFMESDEKIAAHSWEQKSKISHRCDAIFETLAKSDISTNEAVCFTLMARHFKRLSSHLSNISTSVILPVDELDYYDEKRA
ncbi:MAG: hypothetical protein KKD07_08270 [Candidatus Omnitrophica bacterium]|nr:hypothetical protein [Candidatus Omnitrophota bacterium]MBU1997101.1 hypothetical protein [Candidatus Omnitrophota bacterium]MBU4334418.1 hypothetical protein [Candidatus Omnitrophota bacterium]